MKKTLYHCRRFILSIEEKIVMLLCGLIPGKSNRREFRNNPFHYGEIIFNLLYKKDKFKHFKYELSIACIAKNEGKYFKEWIEYHLLCGVSHFYVYDNESTDSLKQILIPYIKAGIITYKYYPGKGIQRFAYQEAIDNYRNETRWLAFIDLDEFLVSPKYIDINSFLKTQTNYAQISVRWYVFGDSGLTKETNELVTKRFTHREENSSGFKSIVNPRTVKYVSCHRHGCFGNTLWAQINDLHINHYYGKTYEEYLAKISRGRGWSTKPRRQYANPQKNFNANNRNEIEDTFMLQFTNQIKNNIKKHS